MRRVPFVLVCVISLLMLFGGEAPVDGTPPVWSDKVVHAALFAALTWTGRLAGVPLTALVVALVGYAVLSELVQPLVPWADREMSGADVAADVVGIAVGLLVPVPRSRDRTA